VTHDREGARAKALGGGVAAHRGEVVHAALRRLPTVAEVQLPVAHAENQLLFTGVLFVVTGVVTAPSWPDLHSGVVTTFATALSLSSSRCGSMTSARRLLPPYLLQARCGILP